MTNKFPYLLLFIITLSLFSQVNLISQENNVTGLRKTAFDEESKISYNNFRSDPSEVIFYMVKVDNDLMYKKANKNSEVVYSLNSYSFVEFIKRSKSKKYVKVRIYDKNFEFIEGWVRKKTLKKEKFYGSSLKLLTKNKEKKKELIKIISEHEISPYWVKKDNTNLFANNNLTGNIIKTFKTGDQIFVSNIDIQTGIASVNFKEAKGIYLKGFVGVRDISEVLLIDGKTDFGNLFKEFDQSLIENDIIRESFISYKIIKIKGTLKEQIIEDKRCRFVNEDDDSGDSLAYKSSLSNNKYKFNEVFTTLGNMKNRLYSMYRFLPDEKIFMSNDTLNCKVLEIVYKPRVSSIELSGVKEGKILNKKAILYIHTSKELDDLQIVIQRKVEVFEWTYKYDLSNSKYIKNIYDKTVKMKRMVAFRKY